MIARLAPPRGQRAFTLLELLIGVAIMAILAVTVIPSYDTMRNRARLRGAADNLQLDLQYARSEALQRNTIVTVVFTTGASWCYGIHEGTTTCDCSTAACNIKNVASAQYRNVSMSSASFPGASGSGGRYQIRPRRGETTDTAGATASGSVAFASGTLGAVAQVNEVGRIRLCSPSGGVPGYPSC